MTGKQLKLKRLMADLSQLQVAHRAGLDNALLCRIERGHLEATADQHQKILQAIAELIKAREEVRAVAERVGWRM